MLSGGALPLGRVTGRDSWRSNKVKIPGTDSGKEPGSKAGP